MSEETFRMQKSCKITILGVFVADTSFRADRQPNIGETILGNSFAIGPGGKGSNQSVAAARLGGEVTFITNIGKDTFGDMAMKVWEEAGVTAAVKQLDDSYTGAAYIFVDETNGDNAIIICPGAAATISVDDIESHRELIAGSAVFVTQLEQPIDAATRGLEIARQNGVTTVLNPAPAAPLEDEIFALCDYLTPNETETAALTDLEVLTVDQARAAGDVLLSKGVGTALITLGDAGALLHNRQHSVLVPAVDAGPLVETTGAGDACFPFLIPCCPEVKTIRGPSSK